jgi:hypothetical protein
MCTANPNQRYSHMKGPIPHPKLAATHKETFLAEAPFVKSSSIIKTKAIPHLSSSKCNWLHLITFQAVTPSKITKTLSHTAKPSLVQKTSSILMRATCSTSNTTSRVAIQASAPSPALSASNTAPTAQPTTIK